MPPFVNNYRFQDTEIQRLVTELEFLLNKNLDSDNIKSTAQPSNEFFFWETPTPGCDGTTTVFYCTKYIQDTLYVIASNTLLTLDSDYTQGDGYFTMATAPASDIILRCWGVKA